MGVLDLKNSEVKGMGVLDLKNTEEYTNFRAKLTGFF